MNTEISYFRLHRHLTPLSYSLFVDLSYGVKRCSQQHEDAFLGFFSEVAVSFTFIRDGGYPRGIVYGGEMPS